jgi:succinate-acetate transporter protein
MTKKMNPEPLGLLGFGMTTILLNLANAGLVQLSVVVVAMGIALGGFAQILAGILEFRNNNNFGGTAFTAYGFFWLSLVLVWLLPKDYPGLSADLTSMGFYLLIWGVFTAFMFVGTFSHNTITKFVFGGLALLFFLLALSDFTRFIMIKHIAGYVGIITGLFAMYSAVGEIVNEELGKQVFPL